jgi:hypothetical protein
LSTNNKRGLQDALRGILKAGGNIEADWPIDRAFQTGDEAVGVPVLAELYARMKDAAVAVDLPALWRRLGVSAAGRHVAFQDGAELFCDSRGHHRATGIITRDLAIYIRMAEIRRIRCAEIWGGMRSVDTDVETLAVTASIYSAACEADSARPCRSIEAT